ncbi:MAG TPA: CoA transferase [Burkholderiales bacterium]
MTAAANRMLHSAWTALAGAAEAPARVEFTTEGALPSYFATTDLAAASMAAAGLALAEFTRAAGGAPARVQVDRRLASFWFGLSVRPIGWPLPAPRDPVTGDYATRDGWLRLHANAPHHRAAIERVIGAQVDEAGTARSVAAWNKGELEQAIVAAGGCAAEMRSADEWRAHAQGRALAAEPLVHFETVEGGARAAWQGDAARPLAGIKVLDLTRILAGPVATRCLAAYGAQVLRLDPVHWEEPSQEPEVTLGKRCARLDLRAAGDRAVFEQLLARADVLVHGYRSDALERMGLGAQWRRRIAPGLVDVSLDAYGHTGPWAQRRGFDSLVQMSSGIAAAGMHWRGANKPVPLPVQALDQATGYLMAAAAVRGLAERLKSGAGTCARLSLARTAKLLVDQGAAPREPPLAPEAREDQAPVIEKTVWGEARRLHWPLAIGGIIARWDHPAGPLGAATASWAPD